MAAPTAEFERLILSGKIEHGDDVERACREPTERAPAGEAADEDIVVAGEVLHANAVAGNCGGV